jgi:hypothetical protein
VTTVGKTMTLITIGRSVYEVTTAITSGPALQHLRTTMTSRVGRGEGAEETEVSRGFTAEVLPGISEMRKPLGEGRAEYATPELSVCLSRSCLSASVAGYGSNRSRVNRSSKITIM